MKTIKKILDFFFVKRNRSVKELLELMLEHQGLFYSGLCSWIYSMRNKSLISDKEYCLLRDYIRANKPENKTNFWWEHSKITPRINWINTQIEKLK